MGDVTREEFESRQILLKDDINNLGKVMRTDLATYKKEVREDFQSVWKSIDMMLFKVGVVVTICSTLVMVIFRALPGGK